MPIPAIPLMMAIGTAVRVGGSMAIRYGSKLIRGAPKLIKKGHSLLKNKTIRNKLNSVPSYKSAASRTYANLHKGGFASSTKLTKFRTFKPTKYGRIFKRTLRKAGSDVKTGFSQLGAMLGTETVRHAKFYKKVISPHGTQFKALVKRPTFGQKIWHAPLRTHGMTPLGTSKDRVNRLYTGFYSKHRKVEAAIKGRYKKAAVGGFISYKLYKGD